jgi:ABC-2 type transport system permease protein
MKHSFLNMLRAGLFFEVSILKNNKGLLFTLLARPYLVLLMLYFLYQQLQAETSPKDLVLLSLTVTGSIDVLWDIAGRGIILRMHGILPYYTVVPEGLLVSLTITFLPKYLLENLLKTLVFLPLLVIYLDLLSALEYEAGVFFLLILGLLPLIGLSMLLAGLTLMAKEESPWLDWITPIILLASGAIYPLSVLPPWLQAISRLLPTTYIVEAADMLTQHLETGGFFTSVIVAMMILSIGYNIVSASLAKRAEEKLLVRGI